jgi:predicted AlkP superfamily phosphohydrolase/phosphomutase
MWSRPSKLILIGLDAPIAPRVYRFAMDGDLPNIKRLIENGVYFSNCLVPFPTITPPNWTTIVTGATVGTHGITCFNLHKPGEPLDKIVQAFDSRDVKAEFIWNAAERIGKRTILLNYPTTWPPTLKDGIQLGGMGLCLNEWLIGVPPWATPMTLCNEQIFCTEELPQATNVTMRKASGWSNVDLRGDDLEVELPLQYRSAKLSVKPKSYYALVRKGRSGGYETVAIAKHKDGNSIMAELSVGQWSDVLRDEFETEEGTMEAVFRCKLVSLSHDASEFSLYFTSLCALDGWDYPQGTARKIKSTNGLPLPRNGFNALMLGWIDAKTFVEIVDMQHTWYADAAEQLFKDEKWDLFFMQAHCPDFAYHAFATQLDPLTCPDENMRKEFEECEIGFYKSIDAMIGRIVGAAGEDVLTVIVSDHGAKATTNPFDVASVLESAGLLKYADKERRVVDWSATKAFPQRAAYIYVNLKGRDPNGIVEPEEYDEVRDKVIEALYNYTDKRTGKKPVTLALKREDARIIGLHGELVGDVVYAINPLFMGQHGPHLPTAEFGIGSLKGLLIMSGPGIRKGITLERTVWLMDIVPTVCYLMELPVPAQCEGAIIYQALEDPDMHLHEKQKLQRNYERLKRAFEANISLTHTYTQEPEL